MPPVLPVGCGLFRVVGVSGFGLYGKGFEQGQRPSLVFSVRSICTTTPSCTIAKTEP
jgi:hypothetical protein